MITAILTVVATLWVAGLIIMVVAAWRAPAGFEDQDGFHEVEPCKEGPEHEQLVRATVRSR